MSTLGKAMAIACDVFKGHTDRGGRPYAEHCMAVAEGVRHLGDRYMIVGWLHDVPEDYHITKVSFSDLIEEGFDDEIIAAIRSVTKYEGEEYTAAIARAKADPIGRAVKKSDLRHNMMLSRLKCGPDGLREKDFERMRKYSLAYKELE